MFGSPKKRFAAALLLAVLAMGACGDDNGGSSGSPTGSGSASEPGHDHGSGSEPGSAVVTIPPSEATVTVDVALKDFKIEMPSTIQGQKILFKVKNDGGTPHEFVIVQGTEELIATAELASDESTDLAVELQPGRYTAKCLVGSGGGRHDKLGMVANFTVA